MIDWLFPYRYWLVNDFCHGVMVKRARFCPVSSIGLDDLLDGPFDSNEDAIHALTLWKARPQLKKLFRR